MLDTILLLVSSFYLPICFEAYLEKRVSVIRRLVGYTCCALTMFVVGMVQVSELYLPIIFVITGVILHFVCKVRIKELWIIIISYVQCSIIGVFVDFLILNYLGDTKKIIQQLVSYLGTAILIVVVSFIIKKIVNRLKSGYAGKYNNSLFLMIVCNAVLLSILILVNNWVSRVNNWNATIQRVNIIIYVIYAVIMLIVTWFIFKAGRVVSEAEQEKKQLENLVEYSEQIESMYTDLRSFKHDYVNIMSTMAGYFESKDYEGLEQYFNDNIVPVSKKLSRDNYRLNQLKNIENIAIKGLISSKLIYAHEIGIDVYIDIMDPIDSFYVRDVDLGRILGVYLDNALEAVKECSDKRIRFNITKTDKNICIVIANTYNSQVEIPLGMINKKGYSSKGNNRGLGLYNVDIIASKYSNIFKYTKIEDGFFIQQIEIRRNRRIYDQKTDGYCVVK